VSTAATFPRCHPTSADRGYGKCAVAARRREELREFGSRLSDHQERRGCGRKIRKGRVGSATEILEVTTSCRCKWLCPTCGYTAWWREAAQLKRRLRGWTAQGGAVALLTLTQSHGLNDGLTALWDRMEDGWDALKRGSGWTADKQAHGVRGYVRITEVVHSPATGWHVHFHVILLLDRELDQLAMDGLKASLATRFAPGVARRGGQATVGCQHLQPMTPGTEGALANYLFKGTTIDRSNDGSPTPMAILDDLESTGEGLALWDEFTAAVSADRRMQVITSRGIDSLCTAPRHHS
jgi:Replication protein